VGDVISGVGFDHFHSGYLAQGPNCPMEVISFFLLETRLKSDFF